MRRLARPLTIGILVITGLGCSDGGATHVEDPESIAVTTLPSPVPPAGEPAARWVDRGEAFALTTYGSSSCPTVPTAIKVDADLGLITVTASGNYEGPCTANRAPYTVVVKVPGGIDLSRAVRLVVVEDGEKDLRFNL